MGRAVVFVVTGVFVTSAVYVDFVASSMLHVGRRGDCIPHGV